MRYFFLLVGLLLIVPSAKASTPTDDFLLAMRDGDFSDARDALAKGAAVNAKDENGMTGLHYAALEGDSLMVALLVSRGASLEARDEDGRRPLHLAAMEGHTSVVQHLLDRAAQLAPEDHEGQTPLHLASLGGYELVIRLLLDRGMHPDPRDNDGETPLVLAVKEGKQRVLRLLLMAKADVNSQDFEGITPLQWAVKENDLAIAEFLLKEGANPLLKNFDGKTPLDLAKESGKTPMISLLEKRAATLRAKAVIEPPEPYLLLPAGDAKASHKQFHQAVVVGDLDKVRRLLQAEPALLTASLNKEGVQAVHLAAAVGNPEILKWLVEKGASVKAKTGVGATLLHLCALRFSPAHWERISGSPAPDPTKPYAPPGQVGAAAWLIQKRVPAGARDKAGYTALQRGVFYGNTGLVAVLADLGGVVNDAGAAPQRYSPLHLAAAIGDLNMVRLLVERGARLNSPARNFKTPLDIATEAEKQAVVNLLKDKGAKVGKARNPDQPKPKPTQEDWLAAASQGDVDLLGILIRRGADLKAKDEGGRTALHLAAASSSSGAVALLADSKMDLNARDNKNLTPLLTCVLFRKTENCEVLLDKGADINATLPKYGGALHGAVFNNDLKIVKMLLRKGVDINQATESGDTALHFAIQKGNADLAGLLLNAGADPGLKNQAGKTPKELGQASSVAAIKALFP